MHSAAIAVTISRIQCYKGALRTATSELPRTHASILRFRLSHDMAIIIATAISKSCDDGFRGHDERYGNTVSMTFRC